MDVLDIVLEVLEAASASVLAATAVLEYILKRKNRPSDQD